MYLDNGNLQALTGGLKLKVRIQHPGVHERTDRGGSYWYFRYWDDVLQRDGTTKAMRKFHTVGPSKGENRLSKKQAEVERDKFLAKINKPTIQEKVADGLVLFSRMVEKYRAAHVEAEVAGRFLLAKPTRAEVSSSTSSSASSHNGATGGCARSIQTRSSSGFSGPAIPGT